MRFNFIFIAAFAFKAAAIAVVSSLFICFVYFHYFSSVWLVVKFIRLSADGGSDSDRRRQQRLQRSDASEMCVLSILPKATFVSTSRRNEPNIFFEYITSPCHTAFSLSLCLYLSCSLKWQPACHKSHRNYVANISVG